MIVLLLVSALALVYLFDNFYWKRRNLPPGPVPLPLIGNAFSFQFSQPPQQLIEWRRQYGDIYTYWLGGLPVVTVNDLSTINDSFVRDGDSFAGRPHQITEFLEVNRNGRTGILFNDGQVWRDLRRFSLHTLKDFGVGRNVMQERILEEVSILIQSVKEDQVVDGAQHKAQDIQNHIDVAVGSIIIQLIFGFRHTSSSQNRPEFFKFKALISEFTTMASSFAGLLFQSRAHVFKHVPFLSSTYRRMEDIRDTLFRMLESNVEQLRRQIDWESHAEPRDYVEAFLRKQREMAHKGCESFTDTQLAGTLWDMYFAGQETTSNTIGWACIYLTNRPDIQRKVHAELDAVIGCDRLVTNEDKPRLHYLNALVTEIQRLCNLVPLNVQHRLVKDVQLHGYTLPRNTVVQNQISVVMYDPQLFPEPLQLLPERHLDGNGQFKPHPAVIPFGVGKRSCLGEALARMELFLFISNICQSFKLSSEGPVSEHRAMSGTIQPPPYTCIVQNRHQKL